jgi:predicted component of type VI protein secretion system
MSKLLFLGEKFNGRSYELVAEKTAVGRGDQNKLVIRDESVSNAHCEILANGPEVIVHDLGSANGTFVNGMRVNGQCQIKDGQIVRFGSVEARLSLDVPSWDDTTTEQTAFHAMKRVMHEQSVERSKPKPGDGAMTLESGPVADLGDHTVLLKRPASQAEPPASQFPTTATPQSSQPPKTMRIVMVVAAALVLAVLGWLLWWRK